MERAKGIKEVREKCGKRGAEKRESKEKKKEGVTGRMKRGICALREIRKYQSGTELLIQWLPFQRVVKRSFKISEGTYSSKLQPLWPYKRQEKLSWWACLSR